MRKLVDLCNIQYGYPFDASFFSSSQKNGMPLIRIRDVKEGKTSTYFEGEFPRDYIVRRGEYLIGMDGEFNIAPWNSDEALLNQRVCRITAVSKEVNIHYIYRFLQKELKRIEDDTPYATVKHLSAKRINQIQLPLPSIAKQERIATELNILESILDKSKLQLAILDELELSIFYDSFGNPVINPIGWKSLSLSDVSSLITDGSHYSPKDEEMGTIPMLSVKNMGARGFDYTDCKMISQEEFKKLEAAGCKPLPDDVLVAKDGSYFKKIFVHHSEAPQAILSSIAIVRPDQTKVTPEFLCSLLSTPDIYNLVEERYLTGTAIKRVILKGLRQLKIIVPPMDMQKQFSMKIWRINAQRRLIEESVVEAQKLFDSRMNYYFGD